MDNGNSLGGFLRARRSRLAPADVGLPAGPSLRRTPGLRREELAALAGVSVDYYVRIEQGKEHNPSVAVLNALANALRMDDEERAHLFTLANHAAGRTPRPPRSRRGTPAAGGPARVRDDLTWLLAALRPRPAYLLSRVNDVLAANPEGLRLLAGIEDWPAGRRNTARYIFLHPTARTLFGSWERAATGAVAHLRAVSAREPDAADLAALLGELLVNSGEFAELWRRHEVRVKGSDEKTFHHPLVGTMTLSYEALAPLRDDGQRLMIYQAAPGSPSQDALALLGLVDQGAVSRP